MQYHLKTAAVNAIAPAAVPRVVDAHGLLHLQATKAAKACDAADAVDGLTKLGNPTLRLAAAAYGVSIGYVARARRLTPEQRQAVRQGKRPLILPLAPSTAPVPPALPTSPAPPPVLPVTMGTRERLNEIVGEIGLNAVIDLLAATEKVAA
jgi:hypothetical protein